MSTAHTLNINIVTMSTPHHEERLESILEEVIQAFPYYSLDKQEEIARKRFEEELV
tara:strand:+ start:431 stop:598 length:168 start_codon:yes stop_codon:yes gene_type:complete